MQMQKPVNCCKLIICLIKIYPEMPSRAIDVAHLSEKVGHHWEEQIEVDDRLTYRPNVVKLRRSAHLCRHVCLTGSKALLEKQPRHPPTKSKQCKHNRQCQQYAYKRKLTS